MNVTPPGSRRPSSTPPSKEGPHESKEGQKAFKMPKGKEQGGEKDEEKKKSLFDLSQDEAIIQTTQDKEAQTLEAQEAASKLDQPTMTPIAQVQQVAALIQSTVETMRIGQIDGKDIASLDLKTGPNIPNAFAGANLTISYQQNGITIHFDNFMSPQQQNNAITLVEKNKEQLQGMIEALSNKNIQVQELMIGSHTVNLPRVQPLPPPFQAQQAPETEGGRRQDQGQRDRDEDKQEKK